MTPSYLRPATAAAAGGSLYDCRNGRKEFLALGFGSPFTGIVCEGRGDAPPPVWFRLDDSTQQLGKHDAASGARDVPKVSRRIAFKDAEFEARIIEKAPTFAGMKGCAMRSGPRAAAGCNAAARNSTLT